MTVYGPCAQESPPSQFSRHGPKPTTELQAHDREILAVSFTPNDSFPHLLLTGSADKVFPLYNYAAIQFCTHVNGRQSIYTTGASSEHQYTSLRRIQMKFFKSWDTTGHRSKHFGRGVSSSASIVVTGSNLDCNIILNHKYTMI